MLDSMQGKKQKDKKMDYWHLGQMYACDNDYATAIIYLKKSTNMGGRLMDREWRLYYKGTLAFLKKDKMKLKTCHTRLWGKHSSYYEKNACALKGLYENFDKPYREAYGLPCK